ncbi:MAG: hypothetical protein DRQ55_11465 [Planctomycetota bacterium]|nr:MAG: hypothetical protein DRQ55_11465 [Planctomycetota bacterium]
MIPWRRTWILLATGTLVVLLGALLMLSGLFGGERRGHESGSPPVAIAVADPVERSADGLDVPAPPPSHQPDAVADPPEVALRVFVYRSTDGLPLAGAEVELRRDGALLSRGLTDEDGLWVGVARAAPGPVVVAAVAVDHETNWVVTRIEGDLLPDVSLALKPRDGWRGRVVTSLGAPVSGVSVRVQRRWAPRPAAVWDGVSFLVARPADDLHVIRSVTDGQGWYRVPAVPQGDAVDLMIMLEHEGQASDELRVPLPFAFGILPDLVARPARWATVYVLDEHGEPLEGVRLASDDASGPWRVARRTVVSGDDGRAVLQLGRGRTWLCVQREARWLVSARAQHGALDVIFGGQRPWEPGRSMPGRELLQAEQPPTWPGGLAEPRFPDAELRWSSAWVALPPDVTKVDLRMDRSAIVAGQLYIQGAPGFVKGALATLSVDGVKLASMLSDSRGGFAVALPPEWRGQLVELRVAAAGYDLSDSVERVPAQVERLTPLFLQPTPREEQVAFQIAAAGAQPAGDDLELASFAWGAASWIPGALPRAWHAGWERLSSPIDEAGVYRQVLTASTQAGLLVLARSTDSSGEPIIGHWGPFTLGEARGKRIFVKLQHPGVMAVPVEGIDPDRELSLVSLAWDSWFDDVVVRTEIEPRLWPSPTEPQVSVPAVGVVTAELREARAPVFRWIDGLPAWVKHKPGLRGPQRPGSLIVPPRFLVKGSVSRTGPSGWPDTCVALCGDGAPGWRLSDLGAWDTWTRPDKHGRFRFEHVPSGDYALVLYRPLGDHAVEILSERAVTVNRDLFNLTLGAELSGAPLRRVARSPWGSPSAEDAAELAAR